MLPVFATFILLAQPAVPMRVAVPQLEAHGIDDDLSSTLLGVLLTRLGAVPNAQVLGASDLEQLLDHEQKQQLLGCGEDTVCVSHVVGALDASRVVAGQVGKVGEHYIVTLTVLDPQESTVLRRVSREAVDVDSLPEAVAEAADALWIQPEAPTSRCIDCATGGKPPAVVVALMLSNNFMSFFEKGLDVSLFGPGLELDLGYRAWRRTSIFLATGLSFGSGAQGGSDLHFQVVPVSLGVRYHFDRTWHGIAPYAGLALGIGFVRTAFSGSSADIKSSFAANLAAGCSVQVLGNLSMLFEGSYQLTVDTPQAVRSRPLGAASLRLGLAYGF